MQVSCFRILNGKVVLIDGENLTSFLNRYPYSRNKNKGSLSNSSNRLKFWNEKRYSNFLRNLFYCYKNVNALAILDGRYKERILLFLQNPSKSEAKLLIEWIYYYKEFFIKKPTTYLAIKFIDILNTILWNSRNFKDSIEGIDFCFKPFKYIHYYLSQYEIQMKNEKPVIEIYPESIIHDLNIEESKNQLSDKISSNFNRILYNSIYEKKYSNKKRNIKYKLKNFNK